MSVDINYDKKVAQFFNFVLKVIYTYLQRLNTLKFFEYKTSTYLLPSCRTYSPYGHLWLDCNPRSSNISFQNRNTQRHNNIPPLHKVASNHQWIPYSCDNLIGLFLNGFQDLTHTQMDRGQLYLLYLQLLQLV